MKTKLFAGVTLPVVMCVGLVSAYAQTAPTTPPPASTTPPAKVETTPSVKVEMKPSAGKYVGQQAVDEWRTSKVVGLNVYNGRNEKVGDINDLILAPDGKALHAIVGVGGFLGMNEKNVAIPFSDIKFSRKDDGAIHAMIDSTKEALLSAPNYVFYQNKS